MNNKTLIINGSCRAEGNTDELLEKVVEGANGTGVDVISIELRNKRIADCSGCYKCREEQMCSFNDDMTTIRDEINRAKLIVFASPLYWCGATGLMKTFIDRLFFYYHPQNRKLISGKKAIIITPLNQKVINKETEILVKFYSHLFDCLEVKFVDSFFFSGIMEKGAAKERSEYLSSALSIGKRFVEWI